MKKQFTKLIENLCAVFVIAFLSLLTSNVMGQQVIGSFPTMDGGFEGQASSGALTSTAYATGYQSSVWTTSSTNQATFQTSSPRSGGKYVNVNFTSTTKRLQSPTAANGAIVSGTGNYTVQFYYRTSGAIAPGGGNNQVAASVDGTSPTSSMSYTTFTTTGTSGVWTKVSSTMNTAASTNSPKYGYLCAYRTASAMAVAMDIDDVVMYAGALDVTAPDAPTSPSIPSPLATQMNITWTAAAVGPGNGVDGGGYMVVRSTVDPTAVPNPNGIYAVGNTVNDGVGVSGTVVYLGTTNSFNDTGLSPTTHYYYRIYSVDKAFNYSTPILVDATTTAPSYASEPTTQASNVSFANISSTGFDINFTAGNGTNNLVVVKSGSDVNADPADGNSYTANTVFGSGSQIGTGNYVVYNGTSNSVTVTGLTKATMYYVKVYSFNGSTGSENYIITTPASGNQLSAPGEIFSTGANTGGTPWATASAWVGGVVPGPNDNVTIVAGDKIQLAAAASCYNLTVQSGGKLYNNNNVVGGSMVYMAIYGTSATIEGTLGDKIDDGTADCAFGMRFNGDLTFNGSGIIRPARLMPNSNITNATLIFNANTEMTYMGSSGTGGAGIYTSNSSNDNITVTVNAGKTLSFVNNSHLSTGSGSSNGTASTTFNINGTLSMPGANSNLSMYIGAGKTCILNVGSSGIVNIGNNLNATSATGGAAPSISNAGTITVGGIADFSSTTLSATVTGSGTFTLSSGATIKLAAEAGLEPVAGPIRTTTRNFNTGANYIYNGTAAQVTGSDLPSTVNNLTVSNTAGVTLSGANTINGTLTVDAGTTLKNGGYTLTNNGTANINGSFQLDPGGWATGNNFVYGAAGTLVFNNTSSYGVNSGDAFWPTTNGPVNVTVLQGGLTLNSGADRNVSGLFQTAAGVTLNANLTLNGTTQINAGGYFANAPAYGSSSTLIYNTGGTFGRYKELDTTTPANLQLSNNTTLNYPNNASVARTFTGNLTVDAGSSLYMDYGGIGMNQPLTVNGNVTLNGNLSLGDAAGGDIYVGGNWVTGTGSSLNANNRAVLFNGTTEQTITNTGGESFPYMFIQPGSKVTLAESNSLTVTNFTINSSSEKGTGTFINNGTLTNTNANVNQYLALPRRTWYMSSPVESASPAGSFVIRSYNETTDKWDAATLPMVFGKGYSVTPPADGTNNILFTGTLNTGEKTITLDRKGSTAQAGFNPVGNPYPSYIDWKAMVTKNTAVLETGTMWYRTKIDATTYKYFTVDALGNVAPANTAVTAFIPPMQAFWVKAKTDGTALYFENDMRSHAGTVANPSPNPLKAPPAQTTELPLLRLQVSNGTNVDEAVIYSYASATNGYDFYDSPKMSNNDVTIPEIYTTLNNQPMVINVMNSLPLDTEIGLAFVPGDATSFSLKASEITNLPSDVKVILKDYANNGTETDLTDGVTVYNFAPATISGDRFSVVFRSAGIISAVDTNTNNGIAVYSTKNGITVTLNSELNENASVQVFNAVGQQLVNQHLTNRTTTVNGNFNPGVYVVKVSNGTVATATQKIVIK